MPFDNANFSEAFAISSPKNGEVWFEVKMVADDTYVVDIMGVIGSWMVDPLLLVEQLREFDKEGARIEFRIDSQGGVVAGSSVLMTAIGELKAHTVAKIWGRAFSMASLIAMACDEVHIARDGYMMIHDPIIEMRGNPDQLKSAVAFLEGIREQAADRYAEKVEKAGHTREEVLAAMAATTYYNATQAVEFGLADVVTEPTKAKLCGEDAEFEAVMLAEMPDEVREALAEKGFDEPEPEMNEDTPAEPAVEAPEAVEPEAVEPEADPVMQANEDPTIAALKSAPTSAEVSTVQPDDEDTPVKKSEAQLVAEIRDRQFAAEFNPRKR